MKKCRLLLWAMAILVWAFMLAILAKALMDGSLENPFREYRLVIGLGFLLATGFLRFVYNWTKG